MRLRMGRRFAWVILAAASWAAPSVAQAPAEAKTDFARLILSLSEEGGTFQMENLVSNEKAYPHAVEGLRRLGVTGGAYLGVGPEQSFHVPVTGDFAGPKALRAVGAFVRQQGSHVSVFYLSNVEQYLKKERYAAFAESVRSLPLTEQSLLIRNHGGKHFKSHPMCHVEGASLLTLQRTLNFLKHYDAGDYCTHADLVQVDYLDWTKEGR